MRLSVGEAFHRFGDRMFSAAFSVCRNHADADDAVQDAFIKYYSVGLDYESEEHIRAWLIRVAVNRAKDIAGSFRRRNRIDKCAGIRGAQALRQRFNLGRKGRRLHDDCDICILRILPDFHSHRLHLPCRHVSRAAGACPAIPGRRSKERINGGKDG